MTNITEPSQLVLSSDMVELVDIYNQFYADQMSDDEAADAQYSRLYGQHNHYKEKAAKNLRKFNRRTLSN